MNLWDSRGARRWRRNQYGGAIIRKLLITFRDERQNSFANRSGILWIFPLWDQCESKSRQSKRNQGNSAPRETPDTHQRLVPNRQLAIGNRQLAMSCSEREHGTGIRLRPGHYRRGGRGVCRGAGGGGRGVEDGGYRRRRGGWGLVHFARVHADQGAALRRRGHAPGQSCRALGNPGGRSQLQFCEGDGAQGGTDQGVCGGSAEATPRGEV